MKQISPNKETIRRVCSIFNCKNCWILDQGKEPLVLLVTLKPEKIDDFKQELESWSGNKYSILNQDTPKDIVNTIKQKGEKLLPIDQERPITDIEKRRKYNHKKAD